VILATQEAEIRRILVLSLPKQIIQESIPRKHPSQKMTGRKAQGVHPEFKSQYCKKQEKKIFYCWD
jgi:hypothetical protein